MDLMAEIEAQTFLSSKDDYDYNKSDASSIDIYSDLESDPGTEFTHNRNNSFDNSFSSVAKFINSLETNSLNDFDEEVYNELEKVEVEKKDYSRDEESTLQSKDYCVKDGISSVRFANDLSNDLDLFSEFLAAEASEKEEKAQKAKEEYDQLKKDNCELKKQKRSMAAQLAGLRHQNMLLKKNISALFRTAKEEVQRKDDMIRELREQLDGFNFRRSRLLAVNNVPVNNAPSCHSEKYEKPNMKENGSDEENSMKQATGYISSDHSAVGKEENADGLGAKDVKSKNHLLHVRHKHEKRLLRSLSKKEHKGKRDYPSDLEDIYMSSEERLERKRQRMLKEIDHLEEKDPSARTHLKNHSKTDESDCDLPVAFHIKGGTKTRNKKLTKTKNVDLQSSKLKKLVKKVKRLHDENLLKSRNKEKSKHKPFQDMADSKPEFSPPASPQENNQMSLTDFINFKLFNFIVNSPSESLHDLGATLVKKKESGLKGMTESEYLQKTKLSVQNGLIKKADVETPKNELENFQIVNYTETTPINEPLDQHVYSAKTSTINHINKKKKQQDLREKAEMDCDLLRLQGYRNKVKMTALSNTLVKLKQMKHLSSTEDKNALKVVKNISQAELIDKQSTKAKCNFKKSPSQHLCNEQTKNKSGSDMEISYGNSGSDMDLVTSDEEIDGPQNIISYESYFDIPNSPVLVIEEDKTLESGTESADDSEFLHATQNHKSEGKSFLKQNNSLSKPVLASSCLKQQLHSSSVQNEGLKNTSIKELEGLRIHETEKNSRKEKQVVAIKAAKHISTKETKNIFVKEGKQVQAIAGKQIPKKEPKQPHTVKKAKQILPEEQISTKTIEIPKKKPKQIEIKQLSTKSAKEVTKEFSVLCNESYSSENSATSGAVNKIVMSNPVSCPKFNKLAPAKINCEAILEGSSDKKTVYTIQLKEEELEEGEIDSDMTDEDCNKVQGTTNIKGCGNSLETEKSSHGSHVSLPSNNNANKNINSASSEERLSNKNSNENKTPDIVLNDTDLSLKVSRHHLPPLCSRQTSYRIRH